jgi:hypothetical protein
MIIRQPRTHFSPSFTDIHEQAERFIEAAAQ